MTDFNQLPEPQRAPDGSEPTQDGGYANPAVEDLEDGMNLVPDVEYSEGGAGEETTDLPDPAAEDLVGQTPKQPSPKERGILFYNSNSKDWLGDYGVTPTIIGRYATGTEMAPEATITPEQAKEIVARQLGHYTRTRLASAQDIQATAELHDFAITDRVDNVPDSPEGLNSSVGAYFGRLHSLLRRQDKLLDDVVVEAGINLDDYRDPDGTLPHWGEKERELDARVQAAMPNMDAGLKFGLGLTAGTIHTLVHDARFIHPDTQVAMKGGLEIVKNKILDYYTDLLMSDLRHPPQE